jgi:hypothetical protein
MQIHRKDRQYKLAYPYEIDDFRLSHRRGHLVS